MKMFFVLALMVCSTLVTDAFFVNSDNEIGNSCTFDGEEYLAGDPVPVDDPCRQCTCVPDLPEPMCRQTRCKTRRCPGNALPETLPGECCAVCREKTTDGCQVDGVWYEPWDIIRTSDPCDFCYCNPDLGDQRCFQKQCGWPSCPDDAKPIVTPDTCCPHCP